MMSNEKVIVWLIKQIGKVLSTNILLTKPEEQNYALKGVKALGHCI